MAPSVRMEGVSKRFGDLTAVRELDLDVERGEFFTLLGRQVVVKLADGTGMTVLVPNTDEEARRRMPGAGADVRLAWAGEHIHMVREEIE